MENIIITNPRLIVSRSSALMKGPLLNYQGIKVMITLVLMISALVLFWEISISLELILLVSSNKVEIVHVDSSPSIRSIETSMTH